MAIHFSILAVILVAAAIWERQIRYSKLYCIYNEMPYDYKSNIMPWLLVFGYMAFLAAVRTDVNDTNVYVTTFYYTPGTWESIVNILTGDGKDKAFGVVTNLFKMFWGSNYHLWFALFAVIESGIFIYVLRREAVSFFDASYVLLTTTLYYNYFSMMRQWFAVSLLFAGARLIKERKTISYIILCIVAAQFHNSAYLFIPVYFLVTGKAWSMKQVMIIFASAVGLVFLGPILNAMESSMDGTTYDYVLAAMNSNSGSSAIRPIIAAVPMIIAFVCRDNIDRNNEMISVCINMSMINFILNLVAFFTSGLYVIRLSIYAGVYNLILYPYLLNVAVRGSRKTMLKFGFYVMYFLAYYIQMSAQRAWPYYSDIIGKFF